MATAIPKDQSQEELDEKEEKESPEETEEKEGEEGSETEETGEKTEEKEGEEKEEEESIEDDRSRLRQMAREQKREMDRLQIQLARANAALKKAGLMEEEEGDKESAKRLEEANQTRSMILEGILETMEINPKYEDVREVVSQDNFDDMVEGLAKTYISQHGGKMSDVVAAIESHIWSMPNPYKFMYEKIKTYHPKYAVKSKVKAKEGDDSPLPKKMPTSLAGDTHAASGKAGWTAAKIDALDESELSKVPAEIYEKYLMGELK